MKTTTLRMSFFLFAGLLTMSSYGQVKPKAKTFGRPVTEVARCATTEYEQLLQQKYPKRATQQQFEEWLAPRVEAAKARRLTPPPGTTQVVTIPVVVHVIHSGDAVGVDENIADAQVLSQITVLNQDFRRMVGTPGHNTNPVGADMEIEFCLAQRDPAGIYTSGIIRYALGNDQGWEMEDVELLKAQTQWDPSKYLNIWVVDAIYIGGFFELAGYAQFPTMSGLPGLDDTGLPTSANTDGVVVAASCFGSEAIYPAGNYMPGRNMGRTASHEIGHFFGLRHIWGDESDCTGTDFCADTPVAADANSGCPGPNYDSCPSSPGFDMIENYMDYTDDSCQNIFTQNQKDRMQAVLANSPRRVSLITSDGCMPGITYDNDGSLNIQGINPGCETAFAPQVVLRNAGNNTLVSATINYSIDDEPQSTYNWSGSLANGVETTIQLPEMTAASGDHTFNVSIATVNGVEDEAPSNDTKSQVFTIADAFNTNQVIVTILTDNFGDETLWALVDANEEKIAGNVDFNNIFNSEFYNDNQLYTITVNIPATGCYTFGIFDLAADGICCGHGDGYYRIETADGILIAEGGQFGEMDMREFRVNTTLGINNPAGAMEGIMVYPNPTSNVLTISVPDSSVLPQGYTIYNSLGQVVTVGKVSGYQQSIDVAAYAKGVYLIKIDGDTGSKTLQFIKQ